MRGCECGQIIGCLRVMHTTACDDDRALCRRYRSDGTIQFPLIWTDPALVPNVFFEKTDWIVIGFGLNILAERQGNGTAIGRIGEGPKRARQCRQQMLRPLYTVIIS